MKKTIFVLCLSGALTIAGAASDTTAKHPARGSLHLGEGNTLAQPSAAALALSDAFASVVSHASPWVVSVYTSRTVEVAAVNPFSQFFGPGFGDPGEAKPESRKQEGGGSGFLVDPTGYVLTNAHVVKGMDEIKVELSDRTRLDATVVGLDEKSDVALLQIPARKDGKAYSTAAFANSDSLRIGEIVLAIGNPYLFRNTVTMGIVSATGRTEGSSPDAYADYIQSDAAVNPGNSGGPLVNLRGEVVGINSSIWTRSGGYQGISFAIPINQARRIAEDLAYDGAVSRGWLGVTIEDLDPELADALGIEGRNGAKIVQVSPGAPAAKAGLQAGDVILSVDGHVVSGSADLRNRVAALRPRHKADFRLLRDGKEKTIQVTLGSLKDDGTRSGDSTATGDSALSQDADGGFVVRSLGLKLSPLDAAARTKAQVGKELEGVLVNVLPNSPAAEKGVPDGSVLTMVKTPEDKTLRTVKDPRAAAALLSKASAGATVALKLVKGDQTLLVGIKIPASKDKK